MPALTNPRHERFARAFMRCGIAAQAYRKAGYSPTTRSGLDAAASKLTRHDKVQARIRELKKQMAARNRITVDSLLDDLRADRELARGLGQPGAAIQATQLAARLTGLLVDRKETGGPGDFASLTTVDEVIAKAREQFGEQAASLLAAVLAKTAETDEALSETVPDVVRDASEPLN